MATNHFTFEFELSSIFEKLDENAAQERKHNIKELRKLNMLLPDEVDAPHTNIDTLFEFD